MNDKVTIQITDENGVTREQEVVWSELSKEELEFFYLELGFEEARLEYREREGWDPVWFKRPPTREEIDWKFKWAEEHKGEPIPSWWTPVKPKPKGSESE
jgi:hypothetical protein